jgi:hypothetical protein
MATELQKIRPREEAGEKALNTTPDEPTQLPCEEYNTWWDGFKSLLGLDSDWEDCMCSHYGGAWCDDQERE